VHVAWGLLRVPTKCIGRRAEHLVEHRERGRAVALFEANGCQGADAIAWLLATTPPEAVIAWTGEGVGAMEFAPALAWPRLFVRAERLGPDPQHAGRTIATGAIDGRAGRIVLVAERRQLRLEVR